MEKCYCKNISIDCSTPDQDKRKPEETHFYDPYESATILHKYIYSNNFLSELILGLSLNRNICIRLELQTETTIVCFSDMASKNYCVALYGNVVCRFKKEASKFCNYLDKRKLYQLLKSNKCITIKHTR